MAVSCTILAFYFEKYGKLESLKVINAPFRDICCDIETQVSGHSRPL